MAITFSLINQKGGVGKSSVTFNLAAVFASNGFRTLAIDADPQGNLSSGIFGPSVVEHLEENQSLAGLFSDRPPMLGTVVHDTPFENLSLLPSNQLLSRYSLPVNVAGDRVSSLRDCMAEAHDLFDVVLIDNAPALNAISWASLLASEHVIVPTIPEDYSSQGLVQVSRTVAEAQKRNPSLSILGILLTLVQPRLTVHQAYEITLREEYGSLVMETIIKADKMHKEAIMERKPLIAYKARSAAAKTYGELAEEIAQKVSDKNTIREAA